MRLKQGVEFVLVWRNRGVTGRKFGEIDADMASFDKKTILITGAASGIGAATARALRTQGAQLIATDIAETAQISEGCGGGDFGLTCQLDVRQPEEIAACIAEAIERFGKIDGLVNSAGINGIGPVHLISHEDWQRVIDVQLTGSFSMAKAVLPHMMEAGRGAIVNISSIYGMSGGQGNVSYNTAKGGILQLSRSMAADYGAFGIRVNTVSPGYIQTPLTTMLDDAGEMRDRFVGMHALKRAGQPEEVAAAIRFLLSDEASFITGANLPVDGGFASTHLLF